MPIMLLLFHLYLSKPYKFKKQNKKKSAQKNQTILILFLLFKN